MHTTQNNFLIKAVNMLGALQKSGVLFKVVTSDGKEFGTLPYVRRSDVKKPRRQHGSISKHIDPVLRSMAEGDIAVISMPHDTDMTINEFQSRVSSRMCAIWGAGNGVCHRVEDSIEVLRVK